LKPRYTDVTSTSTAHLPGECQVVSSILSRVGDKWTVLIVMMLAEGPRRFNELKRIIGGISQRMLTLTLRGLERDGLVTRTIFPTIPPRVDYELTQLGHSLRVPIEALGNWAFAHIPVVERARAEFDLRHEDCAPELNSSGSPRRYVANEQAENPRTARTALLT
jgi:DNA-binding HxlR family transcriptional regulator